MNEINTIVLKALEVARDDGEIGSSLDAHLEISADQKTHDFLTQFSEELRFLFITSSVDLQMDDSLDSNEKMRVNVKKSKQKNAEDVGTGKKQLVILMNTLIFVLGVSATLVIRQKRDLFSK